MLTVVSEGGPVAYIPQEFADQGEPRSSLRPSLRLTPPALDDKAELAEVSVLVADLQPGPAVRRQPLDHSHVAALAELPERWPPILVSSGTMAVVDGMHRVAAARHLGLLSMRARIFEGNDHEALIEAVRANVTHGLPLRLDERTGAARQILAGSPDRSDRAIAEICGIDHKTVARLRATLATSADSPAPVTRMGRDHRVRPVNAAELRDRIVAALAETPGASLRKIAQRVGASPETVRKVQALQAQSHDPQTATPTSPARAPESAPWSAIATPPAWAVDTACQARPDAAEFAAWFDAAAASGEWARYVQAVPLSRIYEVSDQARAYARSWVAFADAVEGRTRAP